MLGERDSQALIVDRDRTRRRCWIGLLSPPVLLLPSARPVARGRARRVNNTLPADRTKQGPQRPVGRPQLGRGPRTTRANGIRRPLR